jgi:hypothetical protein
MQNNNELLAICIDSDLNLIIYDVNKLVLIQKKE